MWHAYLLDCDTLYMATLLYTTMCHGSLHLLVQQLVRLFADLLQFIEITLIQIRLHKIATLFRLTYIEISPSKKQLVPVATTLLNCVLAF